MTICLFCQIDKKDSIYPRPQIQNRCINHYISKYNLEWPYLQIAPGNIIKNLNFFKLNYGLLYIAPIYGSFSLGKARIYDFDPDGNYRELTVKKKQTLKIKTKLREPALTALYKFNIYEKFHIPLENNLWTS